MSTYVPKHEPWHDELGQPCSCAPAWSGRGMVDDRCYYHRLIDAIEELRELGWTVEPKAPNTGPY